MATTKKNIKVRDLKPSKDAKGGGGTGRTNSVGLNSAGSNTAGANAGLNSAGSNDAHSHRRHRGGGHH